MALPNVTIQLQNGGLGLVTPSDDRVVGMVINGVTDRPLVIFSPTDAKNHATRADANYIAEYDRQIADFYKVAGEGAELWLLPVNPASTTTSLFGVGGVVENMIRVAGGRINVIGVSRKLANEPISPDITEGLVTDLFDALDDVQACGERMAAAHFPVRFIMDGKDLSATDLNPLRDLTTMTANRVSICIASNNGAKNACIGLLLGRIASIPVNRSIARVKDGAVPVATAYYTNGLPVVSSGTDIQLNDKGYIFLRKIPTKAGFFWNDDHMATALTDDYYSLANCRTIDKASRLAFSTYLNELNDTVLVDENTGKIVPTALKHYQGIIERAIDLSMTANGEISGVKAFVDPAQDILATSKLVVDLRVTPTATNRAILVRLGLTNPLAA